MFRDFNNDQKEIRAGVQAICDRFEDDYWLARDDDGQFPEDFYQAFAEAGWLGLTMPEELGGANLGVAEAAIMMNTIARCGAMSAASAIHMNMFGPHPILVFGTEEQKAEFLPPIIQGKHKVSFGVTEPNAGLDTTSITTFAERVDGGFRVNGRKIWNSTAQVADRIMLLVRTKKREDVTKSTDGITLFFTEFDRSKIEVQLIDKMGRKAVDSNMLFIDDLFVPETDMIGEEGRGFYCILHGMNPERILVGAEGVGIGQSALQRASTYANEREVFGRPIGMNQAIQHPLAENWMELEAAWLMVMRAAELFDGGEQCGAEANAAKFLGSRAGHNAAQQAVMTHGGMGYAKEFHVERYFRESLITRIAPVSEQLISSFIAERVLGLPKSY